MMPHLKPLILIGAFALTFNAYSASIILSTELDKQTTAERWDTVDKLSNETIIHIPKELE